MVTCWVFHLKVWEYLNEVQQNYLKQLDTLTDNLYLEIYFKQFYLLQDDVICACANKHKTCTYVLIFDFISFNLVNQSRDSY